MPSVRTISLRFVLALMLLPVPLPVLADATATATTTKKTTPTEAQPPVAKVDPHVTEIHGETLVDPYYWLRQRENPEVIAYLEAENAYTEAQTAHTEELQATLYDELLGRIQETDLSVPVKKDDYFYYSRTEEGKPYSIYCRKKAVKGNSLDAEEEVVLDANALAEGLEYHRLGLYEPSPDHRLLAYSEDVTDARSTDCASRTSPPASCCRTRFPKSATDSPGAMTARPCSTRCATRRCASTRSCVTCSAATRPTTS